MASIAGFQPHGLIRTPIEQGLYYKAHIANVYAGIADPKEHETVALMTAILYSNVFTTRENFVVSNEQPPTPKSKSRCDVVIRYLESGSQTMRAPCFAECKQANTNQPFSLKALEEQAFEHSKAYLKHEGMPFVYAATMAGAHARLWGCWPSMTEMEPFWGACSGGDWSQYKDIGDNVAAQQIEAGFIRMKQFPPSAHAGQTSDTYGTSYQTDTPSLITALLGFQGGYGITSHTTAQSAFQAASGVSSHTTAAAVFQAAEADYLSTGYSVSYFATSTIPSGLPTGQYVHLVPEKKPRLGAQLEVCYKSPTQVRYVLLYEVVKPSRSSAGGEPNRKAVRGLFGR